MPFSTKKITTIYDLAQIAEVSPSTVSAILNGTWQKRRISEETVKRVLALVDTHGFSINRQASGLRKRKSDMIGMLIPEHQNNFFGSMANRFTKLARERNWCPIVVSTLRDTETELATVKTLISYKIDYLVVTGATDPDAISSICKANRLKQINVDLPGHNAPSVVSNNYTGAYDLTKHLIQKAKQIQHKAAMKPEIVFFGGNKADFATTERLKGFYASLKDSTESELTHKEIICGYDAISAYEAIASLHHANHSLPASLLINSASVLEGVLKYLGQLPTEVLEKCVLGSYDWEPYQQFFKQPISMVRQDTDAILGEVFRIIDEEDFSDLRVTEIPPELLLV